MLNLITTDGFRESVCDNNFYTAPITKFWAFTFVLSKVPELGEAPSLIISNSLTVHMSFVKQQSWCHVKLLKLRIVL